MALDFSVLPERYREAAERRFSESPSGITQDWLNTLATKPNAIIEAIVFHEKGSASEENTSNENQSREKKGSAFNFS